MSYTLIEVIELDALQTTVSFTGIPDDGDCLIIELNVNSNETSWPSQSNSMPTLRMVLNNDTGTKQYRYNRMSQNGGLEYRQDAEEPFIEVGQSSGTDDTRTISKIYLYNYIATHTKGMVAYTSNIGIDAPNDEHAMDVVTANYFGTSAISEILFKDEFGDGLKAGTKIKLYKLSE